MNVVLPHGPPDSPDVPRGGTYASQDVRESKGDPVELADYLRILRNHWIAVTAFILVAALAAFGWSSIQPKVYAASSSGFVTSGGGGDPGLDSLNDSLSKSRAASYVVLAKDRETASLVIDDLGLDTSPEGLVGSIDAAQTPDTVVISITARAGTPEEAQQLADAWVGALAQRVKSIEAGKSSGNQGMRIEVSESAQLPTSPVSPQVERNVLLGAVLGALLGLGYAVVRSLLDRRIRSAEDVERDTGVPVVGSVPDIGKTPGIFVGTGTGNAALAAEGVRRLRTNLSYMDVDNPPRAIVVTSPKQGDGKSTVAANLAAAIAGSGQAVTLVDADLRRPTVAAAAGVDDTVGLTDVLTGRLELADALQSHPTIEGLSVLTSGSRPPNPSEILGSQAMRGVIADLTAKGMLIIDAPPLLPGDRRRRRRPRRRRRLHRGLGRPDPRHGARQRPGPPAHGQRPSARHHPQPGLEADRRRRQLRPLRLRHRRLRREHHRTAQEPTLTPEQVEGLHQRTRPLADQIKVCRTFRAARLQRPEVDLRSPNQPVGALVSSKRGGTPCPIRHAWGRPCSAGGQPSGEPCGRSPRSPSRRRRRPSPTPRAGWR